MLGDICLGSGAQDLGPPAIFSRTSQSANTEDRQIAMSENELELMLAEALDDFDAPMPTLSCRSSLIK